MGHGVLQHLPNIVPTILRTGRMLQDQPIFVDIYGDCSVINWGGIGLVVVCMDGTWRGRADSVYMYVSVGEKNVNHRYNINEVIH